MIMSEVLDPASSSSFGASQPQPQKFARYRTVRKHAEPARVEAVPVVVEQKDNSLARNPSRYRRSRVAVGDGQAVNAQAQVPNVPAIPRGLNDENRAHKDGIVSPVGRGGQGGEARRVVEPIPIVKSPGMRLVVEDGARQVPGQQREARRIPRAGQEEGQHRGGTQQEREAQEAAEQARLTEEKNAQRLQEQKRKDLERLEAELAAAVSSPPPKAPSPGREKFGFFSRKRAPTKVSPPPSASSGSFSRVRSNEPGREGSDKVKGSGEIPRSIEARGGGIVPGIDAPISAVNAGERRVLIRCKQSSINLPITPETTPLDLIYSAANIMTHNIVPSAAILLESYTQLGLERRIRRYEHIRDVMNSWDRDTQNALILQNSDSPKFDTDLDASSVSKKAPKDVTVYMYHSQKPGKWSKRFITLQSSGQIYIAKKPNSKSTDKDVANICHLSDFDIYSPTPQQIRKNLKPPKKFCYAIKSQQKTTMFLSTENFVHFFNTDDETLAETWYAAVQRWRSWYLVNRMGEGKASPKKSKAVKEVIARPTPRPGTRAGPGHVVKISVDENPYTIGSFAPLIDLERFDKARDRDHPDYDDSEEESRPRQIPFHLRNSMSFPSPSNPRENKRHPPPVSYRLPPETISPSASPFEEQEFASTGLLGRTYSQRQRAQKERDGAALLNGPFVDGPSLLNSTGTAQSRTLSVKSSNRSPSKRPDTSAGVGVGAKGGLPRPLLDFTPEFKEVPQWDRRGKGHGVKTEEGVLLVDVATGGMGDGMGMGMEFKPVETLSRRPTTAGVGRERNVDRDREGAFVEGGLVSGVGVGVRGR